MYSGSFAVQNERPGMDPKSPDERFGSIYRQSSGSLARKSSIGTSFQSDANAANRREYLPSLLVSPPSYSSTEPKSPYSSTPSTQRTSFRDAMMADSFPAPNASIPSNSLLNSPWSPGSRMEQQYIRRRRNRQDSAGLESTPILSIDNQTPMDIDAPPVASLLTDSDATHSYRSATPARTVPRFQLRNSAETDFQDASSGAPPSSALSTPMPNRVNDYWVTVFGFQSSQLPLVLKKFQDYGEVVRYVSGPGNWVHIQYETKLQAEKAASQNGKVVDGTLMVGVSKLSPEVADRLGFDSESFDNRTTSQTPARQMPQMRTPARSYDISSDQDILRTPARRDNICAKLMEYLFNT